MTTAEAVRTRRIREAAAIEAFLNDAITTCAQRAAEVLSEFEADFTLDKREATYAGSAAGDDWRYLERKLQELRNKLPRRG